MGKTTIFTVSDNPDVSNCEKVKNLLVQKGAVLEEINLTEQPEWRPLFFLLTKGGRTTPKIFFNDNYIGGAEEVELLEKDNKLDKLLKEIADAPTVKFPPSLRKPDNQEFIEVLKKKLKLIIIIQLDTCYVDIHINNYNNYIIMYNYVFYMHCKTTYVQSQNQPQ